MDRLIDDVARSPWTPVLIEGAVARDVALQLHAVTHPEGAPFKELDCARPRPEEASSLLFGVENRDFLRRGLLDQANHGTLFLGRVAALTSIAQARISHLLDTARFRREGGSTDVAVTVRVVASVEPGTLGELLHDGRLRRDLFARLSVFHVVTD